MAFFVVFDENNVLSGRYLSAIHGTNIPSSAIEVDEALFDQTIAENDGIWKLGEDGKTISKQPFEGA